MKMVCICIFVAVLLAMSGCGSSNNATGPEPGVLDK